MITIVFGKNISMAVDKKGNITTKGGKTKVYTSIEEANKDPEYRAFMDSPKRSTSVMHF